MLAFHTVDANDRVLAQPSGEHPVGLLIYTDDGHMSAHIMRGDRVPFQGDSLLAGTTAEKVAAWDSHFSYAGTYQWGGDHVLHHMTVSSFPNWIGDTQWRLAQLEGDHLVLGTEPMTTDGVTHRNILRWRRTS